MDEQWGEWIEWKGGECPIPDAGPGEWQVMYRDGQVSGLTDCRHARDFPLAWSDDPSCTRFVAYRLKRTADLWYPPQQEGFGPWFEHKAGEACPITAVKAGDYRVRFTDGTTTSPVCDAVRHGAWAPLGLDIFSTGKAPTRIAAYCLKIEAKPALTATCAPPDGAWRDWHEGDTVPSVDRVDVIRTEAGAKGSTLKQIDNVVTTSQYWGPSSFVRKWRPAVAKPVIADPNRKMFDRDSSAIFKTEALEALKAAGGYMAWPGPDGKLVEHRFQQPQPLDHAAIVAAGRDYAKRQHDKRVAADAWVERPRDHRLGNF